MIYIPLIPGAGPYSIAEKDEIRLSSSVEMHNNIFWDVFSCVLHNFHFKSKIENDL